MTNLKKSSMSPIRAAQVFLLAFLVTLFGCGGGGGGGASSGSSGSSGSGSGSGTQTANGVVVVPALGAFSSGATVEAFNPVDGTQIGASVTTDADGTAVLDLGAHVGGFVIKVKGGAGVTYFEEGLGASGTETNLAATNVLLALVPSEVAVERGARFGVTPLTHMAAGFVVNSTSDLTINVANTTTVEAEMYKALARVTLLTGLQAGNEASKVTLNLLVPPTTLKSSNFTSGIDLTTAGGYMGLFLAELSYAVSNESGPRTSMQLANSLFQSAAAIKAANFASGHATFASLAASGDVIAISSAMNAVGGGVSTFANRCRAFTNRESTNFINPSFVNATNLMSFTPTSAAIDQMATQIKTIVQTKMVVNGAVTGYASSASGAGGC